MCSVAAVTIMLAACTRTLLKEAGNAFAYNACKGLVLGSSRTQAARLKATRKTQLELMLVLTASLDLGQETATPLKRFFFIDRKGATSLPQDVKEKFKAMKPTEVWQKGGGARASGA